MVLMKQILNLKKNIKKILKNYYKKIIKIF